MTLAIIVASMKLSLPLSELCLGGNKTTYLRSTHRKIELMSFHSGTASVDCSLERHRYLAINNRTPSTNKLLVRQCRRGMFHGMAITPQILASSASARRAIALIGNRAYRPCMPQHLVFSLQLNQVLIFILFFLT